MPPTHPAHPAFAPAPEKVKALQYIFDVARSAAAPAAVHEQARTYAQFLADSFNPPAPVVEEKKPEPEKTDAKPADKPLAPVVPIVEGKPADPGAPTRTNPVE